MSDSSTAMSIPSSVIASKLYGPDGYGAEVGLMEIGAAVQSENSFLWVGLHDSAPSVLETIVSQLGLASEIAQDMAAKHRVPKVMDYGAALLVVAMTVEVRGTDGLPAFGETQLLIGPNYLITMRRGAVASHTSLRQRLESRPDQLLRGSAFVACE